MTMAHRLSCLSRVLLAVFAWAPLITAQTNCIPCDRPSSANLLPEMIGQASDFSVRRAGADVDARWKIPVARDGWYKLTRAQLVAAGLPPDELIGSQIRMYCRTQEVAISVTTSNLLSTQDAVYFYGIKHDGGYSRTNVYWLGLGGEGRRITSISGTPLSGDTLVTSACYSVVYDAKNLHRPYHQPLNTEIDHWFAALVNTTVQTVVNFNTPFRVPGEVANLSIRMFGLTQQVNITPDHRTRIQVNHYPVLAQPTFDDTVLLATNYYFSGANLNAGMNTNYITQNALSTSNDLAYLISLRLDHVSRINSLGTNAHEFCGKPGSNTYRVLNIGSTNNHTVLDITDPYAPIQIVGNFYYEQMLNTTNLWLIQFRHVTNRISRLTVVQSNGVLNAATPTEVHFRNLGDTARNADYLMITPNEFRQQAYRLAKQRYTNGLAVAVAPLPDVYNEFGYGVVDADAIKQFIGYAYHHWTAPRPRFALLLGEGTYDPMGNLGPAPAINLPVKFGPTAFVVAAMDTWYGLVDGTTNGTYDSLADVVIGRISISSNSPLSNVVNKVVAHDRGNFSTNALLVTDNDGVINFKASSDANIFSYLFSNSFYSIQQINMPGPGASQTQVVASINNGKRLITYVGHGALNLWSAANLLNVTNMAGFSNVTYPLVAIFSCQNGSFVERETNSLSEAFIEVPRGAASVFSPTALSAQLFADYMAAGFSRSVAITKRRHLGDVARDAYLNLWAFNKDAAELHTYQILGDPGLIVNRPGTLP
jgi:hypothetical protein